MIKKRPFMNFAEVPKLRVEQAESPPSRKRGGCAIKKMVPFLSWRRRGGCLSHRISKNRTAWVSGGLKQPPRPLLQRMLRGIFSLCVVHPSIGKEGIRPARNVSGNLDESFMTESRPAERILVAATSFTVLFSVVGLALYGLPFYYDYIVRELGWSRTQVTSGNALSKLIVGPLFG